MSVCHRRPRTHGNEVLGVIGAKWNDGNGIDGGTPFVDLIACAPGPRRNIVHHRPRSGLSRLAWWFFRLIAMTHRAS